VTTTCAPGVSCQRCARLIGYLDLVNILDACKPLLGNVGFDVCFRCNINIFHFAVSKLVRAMTARLPLAVGSNYIPALPPTFDKVKSPSFFSHRSTVLSSPSVSSAASASFRPALFWAGGYDHRKS
jgi:hypothetical protein